MLCKYLSQPTKKGPGILTDKNILIIDNVGQELFDELKEGQIIEVNNGQIYRDGQLLGEGSVLDKDKVAIKIKEAYDNMSVELDRFIDNTIEYFFINIILLKLSQVRSTN